MLTHREMIHQAALYAERRRCVVLLAGCVCAAFGFAAIALLFPGAWYPVGWCIVAVGLVAAWVTARLGRVTHRIEDLEKFL